LLLEAKVKAFETLELQRIIPVLVALLEYEWITGEKYLEQADIDLTIGMMKHMGHVYDKSEFACWLLKARMQPVSLPEIYEGYQMHNQATAVKAAKLWQQLGCPYEQALALFEGSDANKKDALMIVQSLGADAVYKKMEREMRSSGIKSIPRGIRKSTRSNAAHLTGRELDVLRSIKEGLQNKEIAEKLFISAKTVDHHISSILLKLGVNSRMKAVQEAIGRDIIK
ncbi:MAG: helix-turn-helix domain-containing protein, partial [Mucilaginibacter sp.]